MSNCKLTKRALHMMSAMTAFSVVASTAMGLSYAACWDTGATPKPSAQYVMQSSTGTVVDLLTHLMWKQCAEGLSGTSCATGTASLTTWDNGNTAASSSLFAGYNDWRMPTLAELQSLLPSDCGTPGPSINATVFPNTASQYFWSSSTRASTPSHAWAVLFSNGASILFAKGNNPSRVRLVRGGQSLDTLTPTQQTLQFFSAPTLPTSGTKLLLAASGPPSSGNHVTYASSTPTVCTIDSYSGALSAAAAALAGNTCTVTANQPGSFANGTNYAPAAQSTFDLLIEKLPHSLAFGASPAMIVGGTGSVTALSNRALTPVTFAASPVNVCTLSGPNNSVVTGVSAGTCTVTATQQGDASYAVATRDQRFAIGIGCNIHMDGATLLPAKEGLILLRAMLGFTGTAVTQGTGIATPWTAIRDQLNGHCGTSFQ